MTAAAHRLQDGGTVQVDPMEKRFVYEPTSVPLRRRVRCVSLVEIYEAVVVPSLQRRDIDDRTHLSDVDRRITGIHSD